MLDDLPTACDVGMKKDSKGYKSTWVGYKLHIDVADGQIPISCMSDVRLAARQAKPPFRWRRSGRTTRVCSDLMDAAYDAEPIRQHSRSRSIAGVLGGSPAFWHAAWCSGNAPRRPTGVSHPPFWVETALGVPPSAPGIQSAIQGECWCLPGELRTAPSRLSPEDAFASGSEVYRFTIDCRRVGRLACILAAFQTVLGAGRRRRFVTSLR